MMKPNVDFPLLDLENYDSYVGILCLYVAWLFSIVKVSCHLFPASPYCSCCLLGVLCWQLSWFAETPSLSSPRGVLPPGITPYMLFCQGSGSREQENKVKPSHQRKSSKFISLWPCVCVSWWKPRRGDVAGSEAISVWKCTVKLMMRLNKSNIS